MLLQPMDLGTTNAPRVSLATVSFIAFIVICFLIATGINTFLRTQLSASLTHLENRLGFSLNIEHRTLSFGRLDFKGVTIGDEAIAVAGHVVATFNMNPLSQNFAQPSSIEVHNLNIKVSTSQLARFRKNRNTHFDAGETIGSSNTRRNMQIKIRNSRLTIMSAAGEELAHLNRYHSDIDLETGAGQAWLSGARLSGRPTNEDLSLKWRQNSKQTLTLATLAPTLQKNWHFTSQISHSSGEALVSLTSTGLPDWLADFQEKFSNIVDLDNVPIQLRSRLRLNSNERRIDYNGFIYARDVTIKQQSISSRPIGPLPLSFKLAGHVDIEKSRVEVTDGIIALKSVSKEHQADPFIRLRTSATIDSSKNHTTLELNVTLEDSSCQKLFGVIPAQVTQRLGELSLSGTIAGSMTIAADLTNKQITRTQIRTPSHNCRIASAPAAFSVAQLRNSKTLGLRADRGLTLAPFSRPASPNFVEFPYIPRTIQLAFVMSEDSGFWQHSGIEWGMLAAALQQNISAGRVEVGGSTISMQTAKNLFLSHERTLIRKIEELLLTWHLERHLSKERIFEIYANIIEYGPNIYGLSDAAAIIFEKPSYQLNLAEASFLATLLPNPRARFSHVCNGYLSDGYQRFVTERLERLLSSGQINALHFQQAIGHLADIRFNPNIRQNTAHCDQQLSTLTKLEQKQHKASSRL